jgi:hypothetical protein
VQISVSRIKVDWRLQLPAVLLAVALLGGAMRAQDGVSVARQDRLDEILDLNVRDGFVYYRALASEHAKLDAYVTSLASARLESASPQEQVAFWINAYNAVVLQTVVTHYPIQTRSNDYPAGSIRQVPGAFERETHRLAGRTLTLDQIEQTVLPAFHDPRIFFALGRGAVGSGRLRSEAYAADRLEEQLADDAAECASRSQCVQIDASQDVMKDQFVAAYADRARNGFSSRSPVERAVLAFIDPKMLTAEQDLLRKNTFRVEYLPFDWSLNDLTGRGGR